MTFPYRRNVSFVRTFWHGAHVARWAAAAAMTAGHAAVTESRWERPPALEPSRRLFDSWKAPVPARTLMANIHYVGTSGIASYLITTPAGHFLLDPGFDDTVPQVLAGIEQLGFRAEDIRYLLSSHAHVDHVGGLAQLQRLTGATVIASAADARVLASGGADDHSPFPKALMRYPPVRVDRVLADGDRFTLGGVTVTAYLTPGHTAGATTWTTRVASGARTLDVVFLSSLSIVQGTRLVGNRDHPGIRADYERSFRILAELPCDVFFGFHVSPVSLEVLMTRLSAIETGTVPNPFHDPESGWKAQLAAAERAYRTQLAAEQKARGAGHCLQPDESCPE